MAAGKTGVEAETADGDTIRTVIERTAGALTSEARALILDDAGAVRASLFVAIDGEHTRDLDQAATANELLLMPPMAGG